MTNLIFLDNLRHMDTIETNNDKLWELVNTCKYLCYLMLTCNNFEQFEASWGRLRQLWTIMMYLLKTNDNFYGLFTICVNMWWLVMNGSTCDNLWQLVTTYGDSRQLVQICDHLWNLWLVTSCENLWQLVTTFDSLRRLVTTCDA